MGVMRVVRAAQGIKEARISSMQSLFLIFLAGGSAVGVGRVAGGGCYCGNGGSEEEV
jgi:hypothetical protein